MTDVWKEKHLKWNNGDDAVRTERNWPLIIKKDDLLNVIKILNDEFRNLYRAFLTSLTISCVTNPVHAVDIICYCGVNW